MEMVVDVYAVGEVREVGCAPAGKAHGVYLNRNDVAALIFYDLDMCREILEPERPGDSFKRGSENADILLDNFARSEIEPIAHVILAGEGMLENIQDDRLVSAVKVDVNRELVPFYQFFDYELGTAKNRLWEIAAEIVYFRSDRRLRLFPIAGGFDFMDAHAQKADCGLDDKFRGQVARRIKLARRYSTEVKTWIDALETFPELALIFAEPDKCGRFRPGSALQHAIDGVF